MSMDVSIAYENSAGLRASLTGGANGLCLETEITGLGSEVQISSAARPDGFGSRVLSIAHPERTVIFQVAVRDEKALTLFHSLFRPGDSGFLLLEEGERKRRLAGWIQAVGADVPGRIPAHIPVTFYSPDGLYRSSSEYNSFVAGVIPRWTFPFRLPAERTFRFSSVSPSLIADVENPGQAEVGALWRFQMRAAVSRPRITNLKTREYMTVLQEFAAGDILLIDTRDELSCSLLRGGRETDLVNWFEGDFLTLRPAPILNRLRYSADDGERNMEISVRFSPGWEY